MSGSMESFSPEKVDLPRKEQKENLETDQDFLEDFNEIDNEMNDDQQAQLQEMLHDDQIAHELQEFEMN